MLLSLISNLQTLCVTFREGHMYKYYLIFSCFQLVQHVREKRTLKDVSPLVPFREFKVQIFLRHPPIECTRRHFGSKDAEDAATPEDVGNSV